MKPFFLFKKFLYLLHPLESGFNIIEKETTYIILLQLKLKYHVIIQMRDQQIITHMTINIIHEFIPQSIFLRVNRPYIINKHSIESFNNNDIFIKKYEIAIGNSYHDSFFEKMIGR